MDKTQAILQHALGLDEHGHGRDYRNHFVTGEGGSDHVICMQAAANGLMTRHRGGVLSGGDDIFSVTEAGRAYVREHSPKLPKGSRSQKRYDRYLRDDCDMSFGEWLKQGDRACNA